MKLVFLRLSHLEWRLDFLYQTNFSHYINVSPNLDITKPHVRTAFQLWY